MIILSIILGAMFIFGVGTVLAAVALCLTEQSDDEEYADLVMRNLGRIGRNNVGRGKMKSKGKGRNEQYVEFWDLGIGTMERGVDGQH
jgi:hypothetical protein